MAGPNPSRIKDVAQVVMGLLIALTALCLVVFAYVWRGEWLVGGVALVMFGCYLAFGLELGDLVAKVLNGRRLKNGG